jgi:multidrug resistance efflux pump
MKAKSTTEIHFKDGQIVHKGDLLFVIDPRPYEIQLEQANAQFQTASATAGAKAPAPRSQHGEGTEVPQHGLRV